MIGFDKQAIRFYHEGGQINAHYSWLKFWRQTYHFRGIKTWLNLIKDGIKSQKQGATP